MDIHAGDYRIRRFTPDDADGLYRVLSDAEVMRYIEPPFSYGQTAAFIRAQGLCEPPRVYALADAADRCIGHVIFHPYNSAAYELGWVIGREYWGRGIATAVTAALIEHCRAQGIPRCVIECSPEQAVTAHIAEKLGFFRMKPADSLVRWSFHTAQPRILPVDERVRLRRSDGVYDFALSWYQDAETLLLVDGKDEPYTPERLTRMYEYLNAHGELYFIEYLENSGYAPIGDVTFWQEDMPIVIGKREYRGQGIGRRVVAALCERAKTLGYDRIYVNEIYDHNTGSRRCFEAAGFAEYEKTDRGGRYVRRL